MTRVRLCLQAAGLTHVGMRRTRNEDCIAFAGDVLSTPMDEPRMALTPLDGPCVCLVADGMGGHPAGDIASRMVAQRLGGLDVEVRDAGSLVTAVRDANTMLFAAMERTPSLLGMGTTVAGVIAHAGGLLAFNVGDSRVYRIRAGRLEQISVDHTVMAGRRPFSTKPGRVLSQCLGGFLGEQALEPHVVSLPLSVGTEFLICSDGVHDMLRDDDIQKCLGPDLGASVKALFESAMHEGGIDNISIIQARVTQTIGA